MLKQGVRAIGSNSRSWASFLAVADAVERELKGYDVLEVHRSIAAAPSGLSRCVDQLRPYFAGLTSTRDATAILRLAEMLATTPDYYNQLRDAYKFFADRLDRTDSCLEAKITICVALLIGNAQYDNFAKSSLGRSYKISGMGVPLASEFLRNLGWTGFKPDRHVIAMLDKWYNVEEQQALVGTEIEMIRGVFTRLSPSDLLPLRISLLGAKTTPPSTPINQADQLVWLYRSILRKKAH